MPNLKEVRTRIASVSSTRQITSAMKMVSASKLRKAQVAILKMRPYTNKLVEIVQNISADTSVETPFTKTRPLDKLLLIVVTSNKGLCGSFNANIIKQAVKRIEKYKEVHLGIQISVICIGKRASEYFQKTNYKVVANYNYLFDNLVFENTIEVANALMADFQKKKYDRIEFIYNKFKNAATQIITKEQWLPVELKEDTNAVAKGKKTDVDYIFEPSKEEILENLIPLTLRSQFFKIILDSFASEHGARMVAMQTATDNATSLLKDLKLSYNKARQTNITNELIEIVSGANALHN